MRVQQPVDYKNLSEAIRPGVCPLCAFLKDLQARCVRTVELESVESLCNFHTWAIAGAAPAEVAAELFLRLLNRSQIAQGPVSATACSICLRLAREEQALLDELIQKLANEKFREWMLRQGALCFPHARKLVALLPETLRSAVQQILVREKVALTKDLEDLLRNADHGAKPHPGILGRAAESLAAQRGLEPTTR
jgi:hypothetical protein